MPNSPSEGASASSTESDVALAAGSSTTVQNSDLTNNLDLSSSIQLQPIDVNLPAISLPALSSSDIFGTGVPIVGNANDLTPSATVPMLQTVVVSAPRLPQESSSSSPGFWSRVWSDVKTAGEVAGGAVELAAAGVYNEGLRIGGGVASIPFLLDSTNAAVAVQNAFQSHDWNPQGEGVQMIDHALQPVGQFIQNDITNPLHNWSEQHLGDGATTVLGATFQAAGEIGGLLGLAGAGRTVAGLFDASEATAAVGSSVVPDLTVNAHPLEGLSPQQIAQMAIDKGVATPQDSLILWSGLGKNGVTISQQYAQQLGGMTLEMTPGGSWLHSMGLVDEQAPFTQAEALQTWSLVSQSAVEQASGQVRAIVGNVSPTSTFLNVELPALSVNPNVTGLDQIQAVPTSTFTPMPNSFELQTTLPAGQVNYGN